MLQVQHGIMIIGRPLTCKSVLWVILSESLSKLCEENRFDQNTTYPLCMQLFIFSSLVLIQVFFINNHQIQPNFVPSIVKYVFA